MGKYYDHSKYRIWGCKKCIPCGWDLQAYRIFSRASVPVDKISIESWFATFYLVSLFSNCFGEPIVPRKSVKHIVGFQPLFTIAVTNSCFHRSASDVVSHITICECVCYHFMSLRFENHSFSKWHFIYAQFLSKHPCSLNIPYPQELLWFRLH